MIGWLLPLLLQAQLPTVGDTIWVTRTVATPPGRAVRAAEWAPTDEVEVLGRPRVIPRGDSIEVAYPVTVWAPGPHVVQVPGPLLVGADGELDSLPPMTVTLTAGSVLPGGPRDTLAPQAAAPAVATHEHTLKPLLALWALAALVLVPVHLWWRRRGRAPAVAPVGPAGSPELPVVRWAEAGEPRAVVGATVERLRDLIAGQIPDARPDLDTDALLAVVAGARPDWPVAELGDLLRALDEARFAHGPGIDALGMHQWAGELEGRLAGMAGSPGAPGT
ncbi:MAG TPA: hypothetical protein VEU27_07815 [Gemmatimonadales bacterium]|nr:hypothetical protein [Gemmatimonadales bacterium]